MLQHTRSVTERDVRLTAAKIYIKCQFVPLPKKAKASTELGSKARQQKVEDHIVLEAIYNSNSTLRKERKKRERHNIRSSFGLSFIST